jgi:hypothetical protein
MFSRDESKKLRQEFWTSFGKSFPRRWILYQTGIKGLSLKFEFSTEKALVSVDVDHPDGIRHLKLWQKLLAFKSIIHDYVPGARYDDTHLLESGKEISRVYVELKGASIHNKNTWQQTMVFFNKTMPKFELFYMEYQDSFSDPDL